MEHYTIIILVLGKQRHYYVIHKLGQACLTYWEWFYYKFVSITSKLV